MRPCKIPRIVSLPTLILLLMHSTSAVAFQAVDEFEKEPFFTVHPRQEIVSKN